MRQCGGHIQHSRGRHGGTLRVVAFLGFAVLLPGLIAPAAQGKRLNVLTTVALLTVIGAIEPASFSEPSPREVARVIRQLKHEKLPAVFGSEVFPSKVLDQIAREAGVQFIATLCGDDLPGAPGAPQRSYSGMMLENVRTMVTALGGRADILQSIDPADIP